MPAGGGGSFGNVVEQFVIAVEELSGEETSAAVVFLREGLVAVAFGRLGGRLVHCSSSFVRSSATFFSFFDRPQLLFGPSFLIFFLIFLYTFTFLINHPFAPKF